MSNTLFRTAIVAGAAVFALSLAACNKKPAETPTAETATAGAPVDASAASAQAATDAATAPVADAATPAATPEAPAAAPAAAAPATEKH